MLVIVVIVVLIILCVKCLPMLMEWEAQDQEKQRQAIAEQKRKKMAQNRHLQSMLDRFYDLDYFGTAGGYDAAGLNDLCDEMEQFCQTEQCPLPAEVATARSICRQSLKDFPRIMTPDYGVCNESYVNYVQGLRENQVATAVELITQATKQRDAKTLVQTDYSLLHDAIWYYALHKPFSADKFNRAKRVFLHYCSYFAPNEAFVAELYAKSQIGGDRAIKNDIEAFLHPRNGSPRVPMQIEKYTLEMLASALMWMGSYECERIVLDFALDNGIDMGEKLTARLHTLVSGGSPIPIPNPPGSGFHVFMDTIAWKDAELNSFFDQLRFVQKDLSYALALRHQDKTVSVPQGRSIPAMSELETDIKGLMQAEFGDDIEVQSQKCTAMTGKTSEALNGVLITTGQCKNLAILVCLIPLGRMLNVKSYTLMLPDGLSLDEAHNQAVGMKNSTSVILTTWENALLSSAERAIEVALNKPRNTGDSSGVSAF